VVAIVGRPNVGKSALFNRLLQRRQALVDATPGITRDRLYSDVEWRGIRFRVVDTGGLQFAKGDRLSKAIADQVAKALEEATLILLVCDAKTGLLPLDLSVVSWIRERARPVLLAANKVDTDKDLPAIYEFSALGFGEPYAISSLHGRGIGELLDAIVERLRQVRSQELGVRSVHAEEPLKVAIIGRPNVGKSSFLNRILKEERVLVDEAPGTTRDPVETFLKMGERTYCLIDTAGIQSRKRLRSKVDAVARLKALEVIHRAHVCLAILDGSCGIVQEDLKLLDQVVTAGKPLCLAVNKWDLLQGRVSQEQAALQIKRRAPFLRFASAICISAKTGFQVFKALELAAKAASSARRQVTSGEERRLLEAIRTDPKAPVGVRQAHLFRIAQVGVSPPTFHLLARVRTGFRESDVAYLEGFLRRELKFDGTPIRIRLLRRKR